MVTKDWGKRGTGSEYLMCIDFPFGVMKMFWNKIKVALNFKIVHFKVVGFILCELYLN